MRHGESEVHKVLIRRSAIEKRVKAVARTITRDYKGQRVHLIGVLKGACFFLADLAREIDLETSIDFISVASYGKRKDSSGQVRLAEGSGYQHCGVACDSGRGHPRYRADVCTTCCAFCGSASRSRCVWRRCSINPRGAWRR